MILRPHQQENFDALRAECGAGRDPLLVAPCGYGKGTVITKIVQGALSRNNPIIFAVHGRTLVDDMSTRVSKLGIKHGVLMGGEKRQQWHPVQVASIDTLHRMEHPPQAKIIIIDEAHMALSPTWRKALQRYPHARVIGATATPIRLDSKGLGKQTGGLFDSMILGPSEQELISMGYLVGSYVLAPPPPADIGTVKKTGGEFNSKQMAAVCDKTRLIGDIVTHWKKHASDKKTAAFGVDQAHAQHITEQFREAGVQWAYVDADTDQEERKRIWYDLDHGSLMGVSSVGCISVGWDHSIVSCLIAARPTASMGLWRQMLGRGSRPHPGKSHFLVLDHAGNTYRHWPYGMFEDKVKWSLDGEAAPKGEGDDRAPSITTCRKCFFTFRSGPTHCPSCNAELPRSKRKVEIQAGELQEVTSSAPTGGPRPGDKELYMKLATKALLKNYKLGHAAFVFKSIRGYWPPKHWQQEMETRDMQTRDMETLTA